jgi:hypothetical protein
LEKELRGDLGQVLDYRSGNVYNEYFCGPGEIILREYEDKYRKLVKDINYEFYFHVVF